MYMMSRDSVSKIDALLASIQFVRARISERVHGNSDEAVDYIKLETENAKNRLADLDMAIETFVETERDGFLSAYSFIRLMNDSYNIRRFAAHTRDSFYLLGWVPSEGLDDFSRNVSEMSPDSVVVTDEPEGIDDYTPPVKLKNNALFSPYEPYVSVYGLPSYNEIDPTPFMAITYTVLFGIMFGDVGQGAVLAIAGFLIWKLKGFWLGRIGCYMGISSVIFGFVYGSVFGSEHLLPGFKVLEGDGSRVILQYSIYLSLIIIACVMVFNIVNGIRQKDRVKVIFGSNGLAGLVFYFAFMGLALPFIGFGEQILPQKLLAAILIVPAILIFFREPLSRLIERRKDWKPEKPGNLITENIFELIEVVLSYMTNTISFLRVGAYAISHASMMTVVYMLAQTAKGGHNIAVLIVGNIFIMCLEALLAGIQVLRLEFYEMFSRFYSGGGRPYAPVIIDYKKRNE
jgi:V/A-type H+-transporting ATPase subunit I